MTLETPPFTIQAVATPHQLDLWSRSLTVTVAAMRGSAPTADNLAFLDLYDGVRREVDAARFGGGLTLSEQRLWLVELSLYSTLEGLKGTLEAALPSSDFFQRTRQDLATYEIALAELRAVMVHACPALTVQA